MPKKFTRDIIMAWLDTEPAPLLIKKGAPLEDPFSRYAREHGFEPVIDVDTRLKEMEYKGGGDKGIHATQIAVGASLLASAPGGHQGGYRGPPRLELGSGIPGDR
jgi:hypothetical protein